MASSLSLTCAKKSDDILELTRTENARIGRHVGRSVHHANNHLLFGIATSNMCKVWATDSAEATNAMADETTLSMK